MSTYAEALGDINGALASSLHAMQKSLVRTGFTLRKAGGAGGAPPPTTKPPAAPAGAKAPAAPHVPGQAGKIGHPGSRGGKWYRDDHGNVRYGTKPTARFHSALDEDDAAKLHANVVATVSELSHSNLKKLATVMNVDGEVLSTLKVVVQQAASQGLDPAQCFAETYAESFSNGQMDASGNPVLDPDKMTEGRELYQNMVDAYKTASQDEKWQKAGQLSLSRQRQQAVNAARSADRQRDIVKGHFDQLMTGNVAHESIKSLGIMHDMGLFTMPKTLSEALSYTDDPEAAQKMVGRASVNVDRLSAIQKFGDALEVEQQTALVAMSMLGEEQAARDDDPTMDRDNFWADKKDSPALDELRDLLKLNGRTFSDGEWDQVKDRTLQMARNVSDQIAGYNDNQGGHVFKALFHNSTSLKKLFTDPKEVDRLHETEAAVRQQVARALAAQTDYDHPMEPNITAAMKQIGGPDADMFGFQKAAVSWMKEIKSGVLAYDAGLGKAQPNSTQTLTPTGWKRLDAIFPGDCVIGQDGKPVKVLAVFPKGMRERYEVRFSDGTSTHCCDEHLWHVFSTTQMRRGQHEVLEAGEMLRRGLTSPNGRARFMIPLCEPVQYRPTVQPIPAYTLGVLLGDGALSAKYGVELANSSEQVLQRVAGEMPLGMVLTRKTEQRTNYTLGYGKGTPNTYGAALQVLGLRGCRAEAKHVPEVYLRGSIKQRVALLQGLCDTDGYVSKDGSATQFYSTSERLARGFIELVQSLGGIGRLACKAAPKYAYKGEERTGQPCWVVTFNLPRVIQPFTREDRAERYRQREGRKQYGLNRTIVAIERQGCAEMRCIKIANSDGLYLTESHIVTHNTPISIATISSLLADKKIKRGIMVLPANLVGQWPKEIERFRPGSKVQVISADSGSVEERLLKLRAINSGELEADFVILSAGTIGLHQDTQARIEDDAKDLAKQQGKKGISKADRTRMIRENGHLENDPLVQELKNLDGAMIFDEAHHGGQGLKDPDNTHHLIAREILADREYKFGMSATPMPDGPEDLFHLSNLFHPGSAGESLTKFNSSLVKYQKTIDPTTGESKIIPVDKDMKELAAAKTAIKPYVFFQRKTSQKVTEEMDAKKMKLPKLNSVSHPLTLSKEAREIYDACGQMGFDEGKEPLYGHPEGYLSDADMYDKVLNEHGAPAADMVMKMRGFVRKQRAGISPKLLDKNYTGPSPKIDESVDIIKRHFADPANADKPVVIFGSWMDSLDLMHDELEKAGIPKHLMGKITGDVAVEDRDVVQDACNAGKLKVVFIGIKAGGAGLNLQKKAYRNIFLDKPWTPADMEQAVGRTWRTGAAADTVHIHHMKVADTIDDRKYAKLGNKIQLVDSLSFADQSEEYLGGMVAASLKRLAGEFDDTVTDWTPEQREQIMGLAGLKKTDEPFANMQALREQFDITDFGNAIKDKKWKDTGDQKIKEMSTINDLKLKNGMISDVEHKGARRRISHVAKKWKQDAGAADNHPIANFIGPDFHYGTEAQNSIKAPRPDITPETKNAPPKKGSAPLPPPMPIDMKGAVKAFAGSPLSVIKGARNPFSPAASEYHLWEALRSADPAGVGDAVGHVASWLMKADATLDAAGAARRAESYLLGGVLQTFQRHGLLTIHRVRAGKHVLQGQPGC